MNFPLLIYPPFCTPASPPYSLTNLNAKLGNKCGILDLNVRFHNLKFKDYGIFFRQGNWDLKEYAQLSKIYDDLSSKCYSENNKKVRSGGKPELFKELLDEIISRKPKIVAFSLVYSSQVFYAYALIKELLQRKIRCFIGGPAVTHQLAEIAETDFSEFMAEKGNYLNLSILDFSIYNPKDYFTPDLVIPLKTCNTCAYQQCAFCTHHRHLKYEEYDLGLIRQSIIKSKAGKVFFIDDMIPKKRLLQLANIVKSLNIKWMCQLRPTKEWDKETLKKLHDSGLRVILWGVESGSDRILKLMDKGTNTKEIVKVLQNSHNAGIKNVSYIMFGFPTETKLEFLETISFLEGNKEDIDLLSLANFGLQKGAIIFDNPNKYGIDKIEVNERSLLEPKITFTVKEGLSVEELAQLRKKYKHRLGKLNKLPKWMNFFREHVLFVKN